MNPSPESEHALPDFSLSPRFFSGMVRFLVGGLMICLGLWLAGGIIKLTYHLYLTWSGDWTHQAEQMVVDVVINLAILELVRTLQSYLELGRVRVTLILDATLVILIGDLIGLWYREYTPAEVLLSLAVIGMLALLRIVTVKFSPESWNAD
jgi:uncharacterized membrane protein (DUF373 family)